MGRRGMVRMGEAARRLIGILGLGAALALAACSAGTASQVDTRRDATPTATTAPTATAPATASATPPAPASPAWTRGSATARGTAMSDYPMVVRLAAQSLAAELGTPADQVAVMQVEPRDWPDSSLGCPQPGMGYLQVITPGYRVILAAGGRQYEYHTNNREHFVRCPR
jgi:hypothetical protein